MVCTLETWRMAAGTGQSAVDWRRAGDVGADSMGLPEVVVSAAAPGALVSGDMQEGRRHQAQDCGQAGGKGGHAFFVWKGRGGGGGRHGAFRLVGWLVGWLDGMGLMLTLPFMI